MTIGSTDQIPEGHFAGGKNLTADNGDALRPLLNRMKETIAGHALIGLGSTPQSGPDVGDHVEWSENSIVGDLISVSTGAGQLKGIITLAADHTYKITVGLDVEIDSTEEAIIQVYDRTQSATLVPDGSSTTPKMRCRGVGATGGKCGLTICGFIFSPSAETDIDVRIESVSGGGAVDGISEYSWMIIEVLS